MANVFQKPDEASEGLLNRTVSGRSLRALNALNIFLADVRDGVGPYLAIYLLATHQWDPASIGIAMSAMGIATVIAQTPAGWLIDTLKQKRLLGIIAAVLVGISCAVITAVPTLPFIIAAQAVGMIPVAALAGTFADLWGRKPVFLIGFAALPIHGCLYTLSDDPVYILMVQLLDGIEPASSYLVG